MKVKKDELKDYLFTRLLSIWNMSSRRKFNYVEAMGYCVDALNMPWVNTSGLSYAEVNIIIHDVCNLMNEYVELRKELAE